MNIGDRVRIKRDCEYSHQCHVAGIITDIKDNTRDIWWRVLFDNDYINVYSTRHLEFVSHAPMPSPEMDLDEIQQAQELYDKLEGE